MHEVLFMSAKLLDETELKVNGIDALNKALGPSDALRFLSLLNKDRTDYVEISRKLYKNQTINEIYNRAEKHWKKNH